MCLGFAWLVSISHAIGIFVQQLEDRWKDCMKKEVCELTEIWQRLYTSWYWAAAKTLIPS